VDIVVLGAGMQGTLYGGRLASGGHAVTLIARGQRAAELRAQGTVIENALSGRREVIQLPVRTELDKEVCAGLCLVTVRREQLERVLPALAAARGIARVVFLVNHACGSQFLFDALGRERVVLGFPGAAGGIESGIDRYVEIAEQPTVIEAAAPDIVTLFENAGFRVVAVRDVDSWLCRHAIFVTAACGALYEVGGDAHRLASDRAMLRTFVRAVREGWAALDRLGVAPPPLALRAIFRWVPLPLAVRYWERLFASSRGEYYFARHARHAPQEMAALAADVRALVSETQIPHWGRLSAAIDAAAGALGHGSPSGHDSANG
jgi:2-dehydropantoate 2-reductase